MHSELLVFTVTQVTPQKYASYREHSFSINQIYSATSKYKCSVWPFKPYKQKFGGKNMQII